MAFYDCSTLTTINFPAAIEDASSIGIEDSNWYAVQPVGMIYIGKVAYTYKGNMSKNTTISIKKGTVAIADNAFDGCDNLVTVKLSDSVKTIGSMAFSYCSSLKTINLSSGLKSIGTDAFSFCTSLKSITIPSSVTTIGEMAFYDCESLTSIVIPAKVTKVYVGTFEYCKNLKSIKVLNPLCEFGAESDDASLYSGMSLVSLGTVTVPKKTKIISYKGSSAESYANKKGNTFEALAAVNISKCSVAAIADQTYTGKALKPSLTIKYGGAKLTADKHYTVTYSTNTKVGTVKVTIKGNEKYGFTGTVTATFKIVK